MSNEEQAALTVDDQTFEMGTIGDVNFMEEGMPWTRIVGTYPVLRKERVAGFEGVMYALLLDDATIAYVPVDSVSNIRNRRNSQESQESDSKVPRRAPKLSRERQAYRERLADTSQALQIELRDRIRKTFGTADGIVYPDSVEGDMLKIAGRIIEKEGNQLGHVCETRRRPDVNTTSNPKELIAEMRDALQANGVFHTPIHRRLLGREWDEYEADAIMRTKAALAKV